MIHIRWPRELNALQIEKRLQIKKTTSSIWQCTRCKCSQHNQTKKRAANKKYLVVLWAFAVGFFICLCCEHFHHLLSNWWRYFLDLLALFLFACVFWSCSALSSLGHKIVLFWYCAVALTQFILLKAPYKWRGKSRLVTRRNGRQLVSVSLILVHRSVV